MQQSSHDLGRIEVTCEDPRAVANAGLILPATLAEKLEIESLANECVDLAKRSGYFKPGREIMTLVHSLAAGGSYIDDTDVLRSASTEEFSATCHGAVHGAITISCGSAT